MEADLQRHYGLALGGLFTGELTWRRLGVLLRELPRDSATAKALYGPRVEWSDTEYLLAGVVDLLAQGNWMFARVNSKAKVAHPEPVRRPGEADTRKRMGRTTMKPEQVKAWLASMNPPEEGEVAAND